MIVPNLSTPEQERSTFIGHVHARHGFLWCVLLFQVVAWFKSLGWLITSDPLTYIRMARLFLLEGTDGLLQPGRSLPLVVPGYPLYLAAWIKCWGPASVFFANLPILLATTVLIYRLFLRWVPRVHAQVALLAWNSWFVFGTPEYPHFLFHPFRDPLMMLGMLAAASLVLPGNHRLSLPQRTGAALVFLLLATLVRETALLLLPSIGIGLFLQSPWAGSRQVRKMLLFMTVGVLLLTAGAWWASTFEWSGQANHLRTMFRGLWSQPQQAWAKLSIRVPKLYGYVLHALSTAGIIGVLAAILLGKSRRWAILLVLLPLGLFTLLFGLFEAFPRYALRLVFILSPLAAMGFARLNERLVKWIAVEPYRHYASLPFSLFFIGMAVRALVQSPSAHPVQAWKDLQTTKHILAQRVPGGTELFTEPGCRTLNAFLDIYTEFTPYGRTWPDDTHPRMYIEPLNEAAVAGAPKRELMGMPVLHQLQTIRDYKSDEEPVVLLEGGAFKLYTSTAFQYHPEGIPLSTPLASPGLLFVNLRQASVASAVKLEAGTWSTEQPGQPGWNVFWCPEAVPNTPPRLWSQDALPGAPATQWADAENRAVFYLDQRRTPEILSWFGPYGKKTARAQFGVVWNADGIELNVPVPAGLQPGILHLEFAVVAKEIFHRSQQTTALHRGKVYEPSFRRYERVYRSPTSFLIQFDLPVGGEKRTSENVRITSVEKDLADNPYFIHELRVGYTASAPESPSPSP